MMNKIVKLSPKEIDTIDGGLNPFFLPYGVVIAAAEAAQAATQGQ